VPQLPTEQFFFFSFAAKIQRILVKYSVKIEKLVERKVSKLSELMVFFLSKIK
jgi:hypothetical protein